MNDWLTSLERTLKAAGLRPTRIIPGRLQRCPVEDDKGGKTSGAYRLFDDDHPVCLWWNWKAGTSGTWHAREGEEQTEAERERMHLLMRQAQQEREQERAEQYSEAELRNARLWASGKPLTHDTPAGRYLKGRGLWLVGGPDPKALRCVDKLEYWERGNCLDVCPAMLALVTAPDGKPVSVHRTYLTPDGRKAHVPTVKKLMTASGPTTGASIKLAPPAQREGKGLCLGIAEGIETAIAASMLGRVPVWACVAAHGMASFVPPEGLQTLYVFADNDANQVGQKAAAEAARRAARAGIDVRVLTPPDEGTDWNDRLLSLREASHE